MTRYEDVAEQTTEEYFCGNKFSIDAFGSKYQAFPEESYVKGLWRVCTYIASVEETEELREYWARRWFDEIYNDWWHPGGSIMQGAGINKAVSMANCTTISLGNISDTEEEWDNLESILRNATYTVAKCAAYRQGLGVDFSRLRPVGSDINNSAKESSGAVHWMKLVDSIGYYVGQKGRIPAMLFSLNVSHPDILEFIKVKGDRTLIQNANISVQCTNAFYKAVEEDADWEMTFEIPELKKGQHILIDRESATSDCVQKEGKFYRVAQRDRPGQKIIKKEKARAILELIAKNMYANAEPGIQNIDMAREYSNSDYVYDPDDIYDSRICSTNACSEQYLSRESLCVLASQNAAKFSVDFEQFEREQEIIAASMNHFLDNVNEAELRNHSYATRNQALSIEKLRRTGAGFTNLGGWLFKAGYEYGTPAAVGGVGKYTERFNYHLYKHSIENGRVKGSFGLFNREKLEKSPFIQHMMSLGLSFDALRNITCSSIAPTGSLSLMFREEVLSYGAEPAFAIYYWKRTRISGKYEYYFCIPAIVRRLFAERGKEIPLASDTIKDTWDGKYGKPLAEFIEKHKEEVGIKFRKATDVPPLQKLDMMAAMMKNIDSSISITYMLPQGTGWKDIYEFILEANKKKVKSIAAFPDKEMYGIVSFEPFKELAINLLKRGVEIHPQNFIKEELAQLENLQKPLSGVITKSHAPKRPTSIPCDVYHVKVTGEAFTVVVGLYNGEPYEILGRPGDFAHGIKKGKVVKLKKGVYQLYSETDVLLLDNISDTCFPDQEAITRLTSTALRHGADVKFVVGQLEKAKGDLLSFSKAIARVLKKYIPNGSKETGTCPDCQQTQLVRIEGCVKCEGCGWSKC